MQRFVDVVSVAAISAAVFALVPFFYPLCYPDRVPSNSSMEGANNCTRDSVKGDHHDTHGATYIQYTCDENYYNPVASLTLAGSEEVQKQSGPFLL